MVNTKIRLIISFAAKDGEALYSQQKQDQELTMMTPQLNRVTGEGSYVPSAAHRQPGDTQQ